MKREERRCANPRCRRSFTRPRWWLARVRQPACSRACRDALARSRRDRRLPKGGRILRDGYVYLKAPEHSGADVQGYVPEHVLVVERILGRALRGDESVKRVSLYRRDNRPEVLFVVSPAGSWPVAALAALEAARAAGEAPIAS